MQGVPRRRCEPVRERRPLLAVAKLGGPKVTLRGEDQAIAVQAGLPGVGGDAACHSDKVYIWDAESKSMVGQVSLKGRAATACAFRGDAKHLAVGTEEGSVFVFKETNDWAGDAIRLVKVSEMGIWPLRDCISAISELRYSPDCRTLAVASHDQFIDLYDAADSTYLEIAVDL